VGCGKWENREIVNGEIVISTFYTKSIAPEIAPRKS
jgi:hypothetical protein